MKNPNALIDWCEIEHENAIARERVCKKKKSEYASVSRHWFVRIGALAYISTITNWQTKPANNKKDRNETKKKTYYVCIHNLWHKRGDKRTTTAAAAAALPITATLSMNR